MGAAGLMAEVSWKVLERRARVKRSGLAGWSATPFPRTRVVLPFKRLGREAGGGPGVEPVPACVPLESRLRSLAFLLMSTPTRAKWWWPELYYMCFSPTLFRLCSPSESRWWYLLSLESYSLEIRRQPGSWESASSLKNQIASFLDVSMIWS